MAIVTTTQELRAGEFLLRFEAKASQDHIYGIRSISALEIVATYGFLLTFMLCFSSFSPVG